MPDYRIQLDAYAGPLDLLLHLVKRNEIDLHDIPIAELTEQYLAHLQLLQHLDMDQAGEFLVMAATLLEIKSQMIVPRPEQEEDESDAAEGEEKADKSDAEPDPTDPRYELVQQLLAYKRYKDAARRLEAQQEQWNARFAVRPIARPKPEKNDADETDAEPREVELEDVNVMELCEAFAQLLSSIGEFTGHSVTDDDTPIGLHAEDIADRLHREGPLTLRQICQGRNRGEMVGLFLAMLELVRDKRVEVHQAELGSDVRLVMRNDAEAGGDAPADDEPTDWRDPETGEIQYDWPDEQSRRRYERRQHRRHRRFENGRFVSDEDDTDEFDDLEDADDESLENDSESPVADETSQARLDEEDEALDTHEPWDAMDEESEDEDDDDDADHDDDDDEAQDEPADDGDAPDDDPTPGRGA